jgi:hypothetical protein
LKYGDYPVLTELFDMVRFLKKNVKIIFAVLILKVPGAKYLIADNYTIDSDPFIADLVVKLFSIA